MGAELLARYDTDTEIQQRVLNELRWDRRVDAADIGVTVRGGVVTLTGKVDSQPERIAAQNAAHRAAGAFDVANELMVGNGPESVLTDSGIAHAVRDALRWHAYVPHDRILSTVTDGYVTLSGDVALECQREEAQEALLGLSGVRGVINQLIVIPPAPSADPQAVRASIQVALAQEAAQTASQIRLHVEEDAVRLEGTVHSWSEKQAILDATRRTPGVHSIEDRLRIPLGA